MSCWFNFRDVFFFFLGGGGGGVKQKIWSFIFFWGGAEKLGSEFAGVRCVRLLKTGGNTLDLWNFSVENFHPKNAIFQNIHNNNQKNPEFRLLFGCCFMDGSSPLNYLRMVWSGCVGLYGWNL